jgi:metal-responsive CopG/Arc/MetJ family transcriptional regulator
MCSPKLPYEESTTLDYWGGYMVSELRRQSVVLDRPTWDRLRAVADDSGITKSELIRSAIEHYLAFRSGQSWNPNRIAELVEYSQMAVDQMLLKLAPETRDEIIEAVDIRMEQYHGG